MTALEERRDAAGEASVREEIAELLWTSFGPYTGAGVFKKVRPQVRQPYYSAADAILRLLPADGDGEVERLREALGAVLARDARWGLSGMVNDCGCPTVSRAFEREYEMGVCPHQIARRLLHPNTEEDKHG